MEDVASSGCGSEKNWLLRFLGFLGVFEYHPLTQLYPIHSLSLYMNFSWLWIPIDQAGIFLILSYIHSYIHSHSDLCALEQGQATEELLISVVSLASLQGRGGQTGTRTGVPGNQQLELARPITQLHVAPSKSPINWSDCPVDWKRELCVCVVFLSLTCFSLPLATALKNNLLL